MRVAVIFALLASAVSASLAGKAAQTDTRPNVVLFLIDDYGYGDIGFEGNTQIATPNIDRIAQNGVRFSRFYQSSGACAPTRASLLTGRYYLETGVWGVHRGRDFMRRDEVTIANVLQDNGYATGAFGKWHSGKTLPYFSWNRGFDVGVHPVLYQHFETRMLHNNMLVNVAGPVTDVTTDRVIAFIEEHRREPFFCYVPYQAVHAPYQCPEDIARRYRSMGYTEQLALLYGMIEVLDDNIGRVLDTLEQLKLDEKTIVMFLSDDGPQDGRLDEQGKEQRHRGWAKTYRGSKAQIWEGGSITPFYVQWKGRLPAGRAFSQLSGVIDLFPTILDLCGVRGYASKLPLAGRSLWPVMQGREEQDGQDRKYFDNSNLYRIPLDRINMARPELTYMSVHHREYKLVRQDRSLWSDPGVNVEPEYFLYNLGKDPTETVNVVADHPALVDELKKDLDDWYDGILRTGRAFWQPVFEVGNWQDRITGINPDTYCEKKGDVQYGAIYRFLGWTQPGSSLSYDINVVEEGEYRVHLHYQCPEDQLGAHFKVYTPHDAAEATVEDARTAVSGPLHLPAGRQKLTIEAVDTGPGKAAVSEMNYFLVERLPGPEDTAVLRNPGFLLTSGDDISRRFYEDYASTEFLTTKGHQDEPLILAGGRGFTVRPFADNPDQIGHVEVFKDFKKISSIRNPPFEFTGKALESGFYTLNVVCVTKAGVRNVTRALIKAARDDASAAAGD